MRYYFIAICMLFSITACNRAEVPDPSSVVDPNKFKSYIGLYPHDEVKGLRIRDVRSLRKALIGLMGEKLYKNMDSLSVSGPITASNGYISFRGCKPHNCPFENYSVWINDTNGRVFVCYYKTEDQRNLKEDNSGQKIWYGFQKRPIVSNDSIMYGCNKISTPRQ